MFQMTRNSSNTPSMVSGALAVGTDVVAVDNVSEPHLSSQMEMRNIPQSLKRFKFLAQKIASQQQTSAALDIDETIQSQLNQFVNELSVNPFAYTSVAGGNCQTSAITFWQNRQAHFDKLSAVALDILASPASQAYVERIFSVCGLLTTGRRNRMQKSLAMRVCLQLNRKVLQDF